MEHAANQVCPQWSTTCRAVSQRAGVGSLVLLDGFLPGLRLGTSPTHPESLTTLDVGSAGPSSAEIAVAISHGGGGRVRIAPKGTNDTFLRQNSTRYLNAKLRYLLHFWVVRK